MRKKQQDQCAPDAVLARIREASTRTLTRLHGREYLTANGKSKYVLTWEADFGAVGHILSTTDWQRYVETVRLAVKEFQAARTRALRKPVTRSDSDGSAYLQISSTIRKPASQMTTTGGRLRRAASR